MKQPPLPPDESERLAVLHELQVLDTPPDPDFDHIAALAADVADTPIALLSLVDSDRQWFKARKGLEATQASRAVSFCGHAILDRAPLVVRDAQEDERFHDTPFVVDDPSIRFYAGFPIHIGGHAIGTLCVVDQSPRDLSSVQRRQLMSLARQVELQLEWRRHALSATEAPSPTTSVDSHAPSDPEDAISFRIRIRPSPRVEYLGGAFQRITGYEPKFFYEGLELARHIIHPDDRPLLDLILHTPTLFQRPLTLRWRAVDGQWLWLEHQFRLRRENGQPTELEGHAWKLKSDRDDRASNDLKLRQHGPDLMAIVDHDGIVRYQSPTITDMLGYDPAETIGCSVFEYVHPDDRADLTSALAKLDVFVRRPHRVRHKDGSWRIVESVARDMRDDPDDDQASRRILIQTRDMTGWAHTERALEESRREIEQLAASRLNLIDELRQLQKTKEQLVSLIVHDLKNPLTSIISNAQFMVEDATIAGIDTQSGEDITRAAEIMHRIVLDLLDVSRSESGSLRLRKQLIDVVKLVNEVSRAIEPQLQRLEQSVEVHAELDKRRIEADRDLLRRVLQNLLDNSSKYSPRGSTLSIRLVESTDSVRIELRDPGPRVPDDFKPKIFELYVQVDPMTTQQARTSRGLGLAFCKLAVEAHDGRIWAEDDPDGGSCFCVEVPR